VITVGSCDDQFYMEEGKKKRKSYSGRGPTAECVVKPDLLAPGSYITSCNARYREKGQKPYTMKSGTSMSTPVVSGAIALLLSKYPDMSNVEVKLRLRESSIDIGRPQNEQGWGLLNVEKLLKE
jgi:serine protease AprX